MNEELVMKAKAVKSAEELMALAKENGMELTEEEASAYLGQLNKSGELSDEELDSVSGGGCGRGSDLLQDGYQCPQCGSSQVILCSVSPGKTALFSCKDCGFIDRETKFIRVR